MDTNENKNEKKRHERREKDHKPDRETENTKWDNGGARTVASNWDVEERGALKSNRKQRDAATGQWKWDAPSCKCLSKEEEGVSLWHWVARERFLEVMISLVSFSARLGWRAAGLLLLLLHHLLFSSFLLCDFRLFHSLPLAFGSAFSPCNPHHPRTSSINRSLSPFLVLNNSSPALTSSSIRLAKCKHPHCTMITMRNFKTNRAQHHIAPSPRDRHQNQSGTSRREIERLWVLCMVHRWCDTLLHLLQR